MVCGLILGLQASQLTRTHSKRAGNLNLLLPSIVNKFIQPFFELHTVFALTHMPLKSFQLIQDSVCETLHVPTLDIICPDIPSAPSSSSS